MDKKDKEKLPTHKPTGGFAKGNKWSFKYTDNTKNIKYDKEYAYNFFKEMLEWFLESEDNLFVGKFVIEERGLYIDIVDHFLTKHPELRPMYVNIKEIQKMRISGGGLKNIYNAGMSKFLLQANHGMSEKSIIETNGNVNISTHNDEHRSIVENILNSE